MNKTFKTIWNDVRRCYIVTNEAQKSHGKPSKSAVALAVATTAVLFSGVASAAYTTPLNDSYKGDTGYVASSQEEMTGAVESWRTQEYQRNWGLDAQNAAYAYALGYHGQGVKVGQMDSGILKGHTELTGDRWHAVSASGEYTHDGVRYPQGPEEDSNEVDTNTYKAGEKFAVDGYYNPEFNDNHGTGCAGVYAGNRDGQGMHGVAWGSEFYSANTGGTDNSNYGPFPDYGFFKAGYDALVDAGVKIINNSWGTNLKQVDENGNNVTYYYSGPELTTVNDIEYEYFMFKKNYNEGPSFVDAAWDAVKGNDVIQAFSAGNNMRANPYHRGIYPYFNPEAENQWLVVSGLEQVSQYSDPDHYKVKDNYNEAGYAKYWTMSAPGLNGYTSNISGGYGGYSGTSMATPFVSGAFAVLASRYTDMTAVQVRQVLLTTAHHLNPDGTTIEGWENADGTPLEEGQVSDRMGWGVPNLKEGMYGLGQLFIHFDYNLATNPLDVWSNNISQVALDQRYAEDIEWLKSVTKDGTIDGEVVVSDNPDDYKLTNTSTAEATPDHQEHNYDLAGIKDKNVSLEQAKKWRLEYYQKRAQAIRDKIANGEYNGALTKRGAGTLVMTGNNTYRGGTTVEEGTLLGFAESFGVTGEDASATANGKVTVNGGIFGVMNKYNDTFTMRGELTSNADADHSVDVTINAGGTYGVVAGQDVEVGTLTFKDGAGVTVVSTDTDVLTEAYNGEAQTGTVTAEKLEGADLALANPDYAFFKTDIKHEGNKLSATITRDKDVSVASYANSDVGEAVGQVINGATDSAIFASMVGGTKDQVRSTMDSLGSDIYLSAQNASIVNSLSVARAVKDQAIGIGEGRHVEMKDGTARLWATGIGSWSDVDYGTSMDVDTYAGFVGGEVDVTDNTKVGVFFGYGSTDFDASHYGKIESDDIHFGLYGETAFELANVTYGIVHTNQDRDVSRTINVMGQIGGANVNADADITQVFAEAAYTGFNTDKYAVEPYFGLSYMHIKTDSIEQSVGGMSFDTDVDNANLAVTTLGVRGAVPFTVGSVGMQVKGDVAWNHFFGDNEAEGKMRIGDAGFAKIKGEKLDNMATVGLGVEAQLTKDTTFGLSYTGAFDGDITSHGVGANLRINF